MRSHGSWWSKSRSHRYGIASVGAFALIMPPALHGASAAFDEETALVLQDTVTSNEPSILPIPFADSPFGLVETASDETNLVAVQEGPIWLPLGGAAGRVVLFVVILLVLWGATAIDL